MQGNQGQRPSLSPHWYPCLQANCKHSCALIITCPSQISAPQSWWSAAAKAALTSAHCQLDSLSASQQSTKCILPSPTAYICAKCGPETHCFDSTVSSEMQGRALSHDFFFFLMYSWRGLFVMKGLMKISTKPCTVMPPVCGNQSKNYLSNRRPLSLIKCFPLVEIIA